MQTSTDLHKIPREMCLASTYKKHPPRARLGACGQRTRECGMARLLFYQPNGTCTRPSPLPRGTPRSPALLQNATTA